MAQSPPGDIFTRRVCLQLDGMDTVTVQRDVAYGPPESRLRMDVYCPADETHDRRWPAVIIVAGYPGTMEPRPTTLTYKEIGWTISMCQLIARSGMVAIAYTNRDPVADLEAVFEHIHECARSLRIDPARVGIIAVSGNVPTALTTIMQDASRAPACAVFGCGCLLDLDGATDVADAARQFGFANPGAGRTVRDLRRDVPLLITRAGRDQFPAMNASIDSFMRHALIENLPITFVNHAEGPHAFDLFDDSRTSRDIIRQTLRFLRQHLTAESSDERYP
ncbi:MAG: putative Esterase/lipase [Acidobacteria bacterium]|nr:putative Esterase/lipase [Acidobacteriota bacterium]